jgi:hypothetical protein
MNAGGFPLCEGQRQLCSFGRHPAVPKPALLGSYKRNPPPLHLHYTDASKQKNETGLIGDNLLREMKIQLHAYLLLKEQLVCLAKCLHEMMLVFVGFDEPGNGNQEVNCNPLYPVSLGSGCRSQSVYTE